MSLIKKQKKQVLKPFTVRLDEELAERLTAYSRFINSDKDYIISEALKYIIDRDKEFMESLHPNPHLKTHQENTPVVKAATR
jgi:predicted DNA-binding protein